MPLEVGNNRRLKEVVLPIEKGKLFGDSDTRDNYNKKKKKSTQITIKLPKKQTRTTSEGIPSSLDIEFLELNDNP